MTGPLQTSVNFRFEFCNEIFYVGSLSTEHQNLYEKPAIHINNYVT